MSELSLNAAPSPELLKTAAGASPPAAPGRVPSVTGETAGAPNPFAALLTGVLQGAQPLAEGPSFPQLTEPALQPDAGNSGTGVLALPGTAPALPASIGELPGVASGRPAGNPLPGTGKELPQELAGARTSADIPANLTAPDEATEAATTTPAASRPRIFLADLALSRPLEPATGLPAGDAVDGTRTAVAATLAGRALAPGTAADGERVARSAYPTGGAASTGLTVANLAGDGLDASAPVNGDVVSVRVAAADLLVQTSGLAAAGTEFLAGQLAAFASGNDSGPGTGLSPLTGTGTTDAGTAALLGRLGSTGLPPLQPLGEAGAFAGGLADRLLTLGGPGSHSARLKLHPEHLGELDVEISIEDGNAQVWFGTTTSQAREAIEGSLPRLRELFADQGIQLTRTQIDAGGGQMGNSGFGQERRMTGGAGAWSDAPGWQRGRAGDSTGPGGGPVAAASARLLDVWA